MTVIRIADFDRALLHAVRCGTTLTVAPLFSSTAQGVAEHSPITVSAILQTAESVLSVGAAVAPGTPLEPTDSLELPISLFRVAHEIPPRDVRPCVQEFIKRVIVPILIQRFITRRNCGRLRPTVGEAL